uniref:Reverse transcriptase domain-containing protein n=1 Tax=Trichuris muris TaxID=70415 RepID=A0A5S6Q8W6_TRIMR
MAMDDHTKSVLAKGLNFVPALKYPPILDIVASVEQSLFKTEPQKAEAIKQALASFLIKNNNKIAAPNLTNTEKKALKDLNKEESILITKADKGNVVVILDRSAYLEKMSETPTKTVYKPIRADPTTKIRTDLLGVLDMLISETNDMALMKIKQHLYFTANIKCSEMYGLPKLHKIGVPMRPVRSGAPMGSPLSPMLAEVFMEHFEQIAFDDINLNIRPICFKRYDDDIFAITPAGREEQFLEHLNMLYPENIVLTIEKETDNKLAFSDALVIQGEDRLTTTVYRKPTNPDAYLHFTSHHPLSVKTGIVAGMVDRAIAICDKNFLGEELQHIKRIFTENG